MVLPEPERPLTTISFIRFLWGDHQLIEGLVIGRLPQLSAEALVIELGGDEGEGL